MDHDEDDNHELVEEMLELQPDKDEDVDELIIKLRQFCSDRRATVRQESASEMIRVWGISVLQQALDAGLDEGAGDARLLSSRVFASLYTLGMRCASKEEEAAVNLFRFHAEATSEYLRQVVLPSLNAHRGDGLLREFKVRWENHKIFAEWLRKMFSYLDRADNFARGEQKRTTTSQALQLFKQIVFDGKKGDIVDTVQEFVDRDREGQSVDRSMLKSVVQLFLVMGVAQERHSIKNRQEVIEMSQERETGSNQTYVNDFERPFIEKSVDWYLVRSTEWMSTDSVPVYLTKVEDALTAERERVRNYLNPATEPKLMKQLVRVMLVERHRALLENETSGLAALLKDGRFEDIGRMYKLFKLWDTGLKPMADVLREHIKAQGNQIVRQRGNKLRDPKTPQRIREFDPPFIDALIGLHRRYDDLLKQQLATDNIFQSEIRAAFFTIINTPPGGPNDMHPTATLLSSYLDMVLKGSRGRERLTPERIEHFCAECKTLFNFVNDKDMFQESYRNLLMRRLLSGSSASMDAEVSFIQKLKISESSQFTQRFEGMLGDLAQVDESMADFGAQFRSHQTGKGEEPFDFGVRILCAAYWPNPVDTKDVRQPAVMKDAVDFYKAQYREKRQDERQLTFALGEGTATVRVNFQAGWKEFEMMTLQAIIVLCFNEKLKWTAGELAQKLALDVRRVIKLIHPMTCGQPAWRLILNRTNTKVPRITPTDELEFNLGYRGPKRRVKLPTVTLRELVKKKTIDVGRQHVVDAAVVRIMKTRHTLKQNQLIPQVTEQVKRLFVPQPRMVKLRIEALIQQEYLERDEEDRALLKYMA